MDKRIGIMVGRENTFPDAFIAEVNQRNAGVRAEYVKLDGTGMAEECPYDVIVDRISHEVPYYRTFLRTAMVSGTVIINNPFWWSASDDKLFGATLCAHLGVAHPRTKIGRASCRERGEGASRVPPAKRRPAESARS